jgi:hypothetical protein
MLRCGHSVKHFNLGLLIGVCIIAVLGLFVWFSKVSVPHPSYWKEKDFSFGNHLAHYYHSLADATFNKVDFIDDRRNSATNDVFLSHLPARLSFNKGE